MVSDLDLVAVTAAGPSRPELDALGAMHRELAAQEPRWDDRIEVVYVDRSTLRDFRRSDGRLAVISPGEALHFRSESADAWVQNWYLVRETGRVLHGPPPAEILPPVRWEEFVGGARQYAREIRERIRSDLPAASLAYEILTMCRLLRLVRTGAIGSKQDAATWARQELPASSWLIDMAVAARASRGHSGFDSAQSRHAAVAFVEHLASLIAGRLPAHRGRSRC
jgi:hypothetical protein